MALQGMDNMSKVDLEDHLVGPTIEFTLKVLLLRSVKFQVFKFDVF